MAEAPQQDLLFRETVRRYVDAARFVRRDWLAADVGRELARPSCRIVALTGEPGAGKSGFIAQLADEHPDWPLYPLRHDQRSPLADGSARSFLLRVGFQLAATRPELLSSEQVRIEVHQRVGSVEHAGSAVAAEVERILTSPFHQTVLRVRQDVRAAAGAAIALRVGEWIADPRLVDVADLSSMALLDPARVLARLRPNDRLVILVDALDELSADTPGPTLLTWLADTALPSNIRIVLTSRPSGALQELADRHGEKLKALMIASEDPRVHKDLLAYGRKLAWDEHVLGVLDAQRRDPETFVRDIVEKADGNIGYLDALGRALDQAGASEEQRFALPQLMALDQLPAGWMACTASSCAGCVPDQAGAPR